MFVKWKCDLWLHLSVHSKMKRQTLPAPATTTTTTNGPGCSVPSPVQRRLAPQFVPATISFLPLHVYESPLLSEDSNSFHSLQHAVLLLPSQSGFEE